MSIATKYLFIVSMDVTKEKEALFNEVYDTEHVPLLLKVPGVQAVTRWKTEPAAFNLAGERKLLDGGSDGFGGACAGHLNRCSAQRRIDPCGGSRSCCGIGVR